VAEYGKLIIKSDAGLNEEYMISNVDAAHAFHKAWRDFRQSVVTPSAAVYQPA
jgi:hypothetical protein